MRAVLRLYATLYLTCFQRAWEATTAHAWTFAAPSVLLVARLFLAEWSAKEARLGTVVYVLGTAVLWMVYFAILRRLARGYRVTWSGTVGAVWARADEIPDLVKAALTGGVVFLAVEYGGCLGLLIFWAATLGPVIELQVIRDVDPWEAVSRGLELMWRRPFSWTAIQFALLASIGSSWRILDRIFEVVLSPAQEAGVGVGALGAAVVLGPLLHLLFVWRGALFLEIERTTHAQRLFRAETTQP